MGTLMCVCEREHVTMQLYSKTNLTAKLYTLWHIFSDLAFTIGVEHIMASWLIAVDLQQFLITLCASATYDTL